jgi:regulatory protein
VIITAIKAQLKNSDRVSIYVDSAYSFSLSKNQLLELGLVRGQELSDVDLAKAQRLSDYGKLLERTLSFVLLRPHSRKEVTQYLNRKKIEPDEQSAIVDYLMRHNYIDDAQFAKAWVRSRLQTKQMSKRRLVMELKQKGINEADITLAFTIEDHNEQAILLELIAKKARQTRYQDQQKLMQYLARQGFGFDDIKSALKEFSTEG